MEWDSMDWSRLTSAIENALVMRHRDTRRENIAVQLAAGMLASPYVRNDNAVLNDSFALADDMIKKLDGEDSNE